MMEKYVQLRGNTQQHASSASHLTMMNRLESYQREQVT